VSVNYASADGTATTADNDYTTSSGTLNFAGTAGETETFTVSVTGDSKVELDEMFFVLLSDLGSNGRNVSFSDDQGQVTVANDDSASLSIGDVSLKEGGSGDTLFTFKVMLDLAVDSGFSVDFASSDYTATIADSDYTPSNGSIIFVGDANEIQTFEVLVIGDHWIESDEAFEVKLTNLQSSGRDVTLLDNLAIGQILNDDVAGITSTPDSDMSTSEEGATQTLSIKLSAQPTEDVVFSLQSSDLTEGVIIQGDHLVFTSDNWDTPQTVILQGVDDVLADGNIVYTVIIDAFESNDKDFDGFDPEDLSVVNLDLNEIPIATSQDLSTNEDVQLLVVLSGTDVNTDSLKSVITILPSQGQLYQTDDGTSLGDAITVVPMEVSDDQNRVIYLPPLNKYGEAMGDFSFRVNDGRALSAPALVEIEVISINDPPTHNLPDSVAGDEDSLVAFGLSRGLGVSVQDVDAGSGNLRTTIETEDGVVGLFESSGLTFSQGDGEFDAVMAFAGSLTEINSALNTLYFSPASNRNGILKVRITTNDLGNSGNSGPRETTDEIEINISPGNDAPVIEPIQNIEMSEDGINRMLFAQITDMDSSAADLRVKISATPVGILEVSNGVVTGSGGHYACQLNLMPLKEQSGVVMVSLQVADGQASGSVTFRVNVIEVDDPPKIVVANPVEGLEDTTMHVPFSIIDDISKGSVLVTASFLDSNLVAPNDLIVTAVADGFTVALSPVPNANGQGKLRISLNDGNHEVHQDVTLIFKGTPDAPSIDPIADFVSPVGEAIEVLLTLSDVDTDVTQLMVTASSNYQEVIPNSGLTFIGNEAQRKLLIQPTLGKTGIVEILVTTQDPEGMQYEERFQVYIVDPAKGKPSPVTIRSAPDPEDKNRRIVLSWFGESLLYGAKQISGPYILIDQVTSPFVIPIPWEYSFFKFVPVQAPQ